MASLRYHVFFVIFYRAEDQGPLFSWLKMKTSFIPWKFIPHSMRLAIWGDFMNVFGSNDND